MPLLIAAAIWYLVITSLLMWIQSFIEKYYGKGFERRDNAGTHSPAASSSSNDDDEATATKLKFLDVTP